MIQTLRLLAPPSVELQRLFRFGIIGVVNTGLDFLIFLILYYQFSVPMVAANSIAFGIGVLNSFYLNRRWTYGDRRGKRAAARQMPLFFLMYGIGLGLSNLVISGLAALITVPGAKICATGVTFVWNYWSTRRFVFQHAEHSSGATETDAPKVRTTPRVPVARFYTGDYWIAAAILAAIGLRLFGLSASPLWHDEVETAIWSTLSFDQVKDTVLHRMAFGRYDPYQLPFYFMVVNAWSHLAGSSAFAVRLPSVIFSVMAVGLTAAVARQLAGVTAARWAAWLTALSPYLIHHGQDARMYALINALAALSLLLLVRFLLRQSRTLGAGFVTVNLALLLTHYYTVFFIGSEILVLLILRPQPWKNWLPSAALSSVASVTLLYVALFMTPQRSGEIYAIGATAFPGVIWSMLGGYALLPSSQELHAAGLKAIMPYLPYGLAAIGPLAWFFLAGVRKVSTLDRVVLLAVFLGVLAGPFAAYIVFPKISVNPRYFMAGAPAFFILLAAGIGASGKSVLVRGAAAVLVGILVVGTARHLAEPGQKREDIWAAGEWLQANVPAEDQILITSPEMESLALYHWPQRHFQLYPANKTVAKADNAAALAESLPFFGKDRVIYIFGREWLSDPDGALRAELKQRYQECPGTEARGIRILCLLNPMKNTPATPASE